MGDVKIVWAKRENVTTDPYSWESGLHPYVESADYQKLRAENNSLETELARYRREAIDIKENRDAIELSYDEVKLERDLAVEALKKIASVGKRPGSELSMTNDEWYNYFSSVCGEHWAIVHETLAKLKGEVCICGDINARHCPVHNETTQGGAE